MSNLPPISPTLAAVAPAALDRVALGQQMRAQRKALKLTMQTVASRAGLTAGFISQIERGLASPSLTSLNAIARILQLDPVTALQSPANPGVSSRRDERPRYGMASADLSYEWLTSRFPGSTLHAVIMHIAPGHRSEVMRHEGEELFFILSGELTLELDGKSHLLAAGDTLHFASNMPHANWNHTDAPAAVFHVCTMDVFGEPSSLGEALATKAALLSP